MGLKPSLKPLYNPLKTEKFRTAEICVANFRSLCQCHSFFGNHILRYLLNKNLNFLINFNLKSKYKGDQIYVKITNLSLGPQIAGHYGQMGICQSAHNGPIKTF